MRKKGTLIALSMVAAIVGCSPGYASDHENQSGGFVMPGSLDGVNPAYHPEIFDTTAGRQAYGLATLPEHGHVSSRTTRLRHK